MINNMYLKILCSLLFLIGCFAEKYYYDIAPLIPENDLSSSNIPLEVYMLPDDQVEHAPSYPRHRRSLEPPAHVAPVPPSSVAGSPLGQPTHQDSGVSSNGSGNNSAPPSNSAAAATASSTPSLIPALAANPILADKSGPGSRSGSTSGIAVSYPATGTLAANKSKASKKVPTNMDELIAKKGGLVVPVLDTAGSPAGNNSHASSSQGGGVNTGYIVGSNHAGSSPSTPPPSTSIVPSKTSSTTSSPALLEQPDSYLPDTVPNNTLLMNNITSTSNDSHVYYNSSCNRDEHVAKNYWVDLTSANSKVHEDLSNAHRRAVTIPLSFDFPFYGHLVRNVTIATGGFLYTGDYVHSWLAATQYIAPLMANFDTRLNNDSFIRYLDNKTQFTVQWENVRLQDKPHVGGFTFQATLFSSGDMVFVYKNIPVVAIDDEHHPVKVGVSDAYIMDKTVFFIRRKTIFEYHRVQFSHAEISNWTSIYLKALPTCLDNKDCESCVSDRISQLKCQWCPTADRCSTGLDRHRQDWMEKGCDRIVIRYNVDFCAGSSSFDHVIHGADTGFIDNRVTAEHKAEVHKMTISSLLLTLVSLACVVGIVVWAVYAYNNPMSNSGQILIRYRPSQWAFKRGEARYTAATIHM